MCARTDTGSAASLQIVCFGDYFPVSPKISPASLRLKVLVHGRRVGPRRFSLKGPVSSCIARTWPRCHIAPLPRIGLWRRPCISGEVNIGESTDMQITVHATGFDLTPHTRSFMESRLVSALGSFTVRIASVAVRLEASRSRTQPDTAACGIVVSLHPSGVVRSRAEDSRMHAAIDRATAGIGIEVEREVLRTRRAAASPAVVGDRQHDRALELVLDEGRLSQRQREMLERPENDLRPVRVRERWKPPGAEDEDVPAVRRSVPHWRLKSERRGWSKPLSRIR
jgi:ribosome-associated translation inhibitor RaiA